MKNDDRRKAPISTGPNEWLIACISKVLISSLLSSWSLGPFCCFLYAKPVRNPLQLFCINDFVIHHANKQRFNRPLAKTVDNLLHGANGHALGRLDAGINKRAAIHLVLKIALGFQAGMLSPYCESFNTRCGVSAL